MENIYNKINEGLDFDCIVVLGAEHNTVSQFVRFYNNQNNQPKDKFFLSNYEKGVPCSGSSKEQIARHRGVSINNIEGDETKVVEVSKDIISQIPQGTRGKRNWDYICIFKIISSEERVAYTPNKKNSYHRTLMKSDNFSVDNCLYIIKMLSII